MNTVQIVGVVLQIIKPPNGKSAEMVVRYGPMRRMRKHTDRQFVNACRIRVPERNIKDLDGIEIGMMVQLLGRIQGIHQRSAVGSAELYSEVVASRIQPFALREDLVQPAGAMLPPGDEELEVAGGEAVEEEGRED